MTIICWYKITGLYIVIAVFVAILFCHYIHYQVKSRHILFIIGCICAGFNLYVHGFWHTTIITNTIQITKPLNAKVHSCSKYYCTLKDLDSNICWTISKYKVPKQAKILQIVSGSIRPLKDDEWKNYYRAQGIIGSLHKTKINIIEKQNTQNLLLKAKYYLSSIHKDISNNNLSYLTIINKLLFGRASHYDLPIDIKYIIRHLGLSHVFATSGLHIGIISGCIFSLCLYCRVPIFLTSILTIIGAGIYATLAEWVPSITRAWSLLFILTALLNIQYYCKIQQYRQIALHNIIILLGLSSLLINPNLVGDIGFQFSYLATLSIVLFIRPIANYLSYLPYDIALIVAVPISAQVLVYPLQLYYFGQIMPYSILANIIIVPLVIIVLLLAILSNISILSNFYLYSCNFIEWIYQKLIYINQKLISIFLEIIYYFNFLPFFDITLNNIQYKLTFIILYCMILSSIIFVTNIKNKYIKKQEINI